MIVCLPKVSKRPYRFIFIESFPFVCRCYHNPRLRGCGSGRLAGRRPPRRLWSSSTKSSLNCFQRRTTVTSMMYYYLLRNYFLRTSSRKDYLIHDDVLETKHLLQTCYSHGHRFRDRTLFWDSEYLCHFSTEMAEIWSPGTFSKGVWTHKISALYLLYFQSYESFCGAFSDFH